MIIGYTSSQLRSLNHLGLVIPRRTRKELFRLRLWRPARYRVFPAPSRPTAPPVAVAAVGSGGGLCGLKLATWNVQSLGNKFLDVANTIVAHDLDILVVTESWHSSSADVPVLRAAPPGYSFCDLPREAEETEEAGGPAPQNHGGIVVYFKSIYRVKVT